MCSNWGLLDVWMQGALRRAVCFCEMFVRKHSRLAVGLGHAAQQLQHALRSRHTQKVWHVVVAATYDKGSSSCMRLPSCCCCVLQIQEMEGVVRQSQSYAQTLQNYNTSLQADVQVRRWHAC